VDTRKLCFAQEDNVTSTSTKEEQFAVSPFELENPDPPLDIIDICATIFPQGEMNYPWHQKQEEPKPRRKGSHVPQASNSQQDNVHSRLDQSNNDGRGGNRTAFPFNHSNAIESINPIAAYTQLTERIGI